ncbi:2Fe-2S iron-sulfur cluster-binding protein [Burkholderia pseudomultivorans]|uniref:Ferredoxin n=1 Tax=Burkholderia pseudomultivorans TaxID=1207504 RepID=A0A132EJ41_9BURK|nr:2Fe-2S iron-sulfur cluster-binding protein [Burkholderia pseudomultivorans]KWF30814.1 ferredoxin [Burkholderia pseudomultivorans]
MAKIWLKTRAGEEFEIPGEAGYSLMEVIRNNSFDELLAMCGGSCSCATCHIYVDGAFADRLTPMADDEKAILEASAHFNVRSRLSCQIPFTEELAGIRVQIAPEE